MGDKHGLGKTEHAVAEIPLTPVAFKELERWWTAQGRPTEGFLYTWRGKPYSSSYKGALAIEREVGTREERIRDIKAGVKLLRDLIAGF